VLEGFTAETGNFGDVQWQAERAVLAEVIVIEGVVDT